MMVIDGKAVARGVLEGVAGRVKALKERGRRPGLAVVLIGENPASVAYVRNKERTAAELGFLSRVVRLPATVGQAEALGVIAELNRDEEVDGILVQSPVPGHLDEGLLVRAIAPAKDVDGFHPENVAKLALEEPGGFVPCTPLGCLRLLESAGVETRGAEVVIVGRSRIVGKPLALLLARKGAGGDATVTLAHSRTRDLAAVTRRAEVVIAAAGQPRMIGPEHVREGAVVLDVGINRVPDAGSKSGYRLVGDVDFEGVAPKCRAITPVPGGVGPMTVACLMENTVLACERSAGMAV